jgi:hypothetical protein
VQSYGVLLIAPNFWDILHKNVMNSPSGGSHLPVPRGAFRVINGGINCGNVTNGLVVLGKSATFVPRMNKGHKETISTRFISTVFMVLAIAIFKPFGLEMWQWQASVHRAFLVNLGQVEQIISHSGSTQLLIKHCHESLPVSRSNMAQVRAAITL